MGNSAIQVKNRYDRRRVIEVTLALNPDDVAPLSSDAHREHLFWGLLSFFWGP